MGELTHNERLFLESLARPQIYGMNLPRLIAKSLEAKGFVEWLPPSQWSGTIYGITDAGRAALKDAHDSAQDATRAHRERGER